MTAWRNIMALIDPERDRVLMTRPETFLEMARRTLDPLVRIEAISRRLAGKKTEIIARDLGVDPTSVRDWTEAVHHGAVTDP